MHPAPPEGVPPAGRAGGAAGHALAAAGGGQALQVHPEPHVRPDHRGGVHGPHVPWPDPRGRRPTHADEARAAARRVPGPRRALGRDGRAGPRRGRDVPDARGRHRAGAARRHRSHRGRAPHVQPMARRGLGLRPPGPHLRRADADTGRSRRRHRRARVGARARGAHGAPASRTDPHRQRQGSFLRSSRPRPGVGAPRRGRRAGRVPPRRQRLRDVRRRVGCPRLVRAVPRRCRRAQQAGRVRPTDPRHHRQHGGRRRVRSAPEAARREHRERLRLGRPAGEAPAQAGQPDAVGVRREPARHDPRARVGHAVLRGGHAQAGRPHRGRQGAVRLRLAARRGVGEPARLRQGAARVLRRRDPSGDARQRRAACWARPPDRHRSRAVPTRGSDSMAVVAPRTTCW